MGMESHLGAKDSPQSEHQNWTAKGQIPALLLASFAALGKLPNVFGLSFPICTMGILLTSWGDGEE